MLSKKMKMLSKKSGKLSMKVDSIMDWAIVAVLSLGFLVAVLPTVINSTIALSTVPNLPFASFFQSNGVILLAIGAAVILLLIRHFLPSQGKER